VSRLSFMSAPSAPLRLYEVRGGVPDGAIPLGPDRALVVGDDVDLDGYRVYDMSAALVAVEVEAALLPRLTELDEFPCVGSILRGVPAVIEPRGDGYRLFVPQELGQFVRETVDDLRSGL
jgi:hypothetical protein